MITDMFSPILAHDYLALSGRRYPAKEALICGSERWSYAALESISTNMSIALAAAGLKRRDRAVVLLDNCPEAVLSIYGILKARATFAVLNYTVKARKLAYVLKDSGAKILITHTDKAKIVSEALSDCSSECRSVIWVGANQSIPLIPSVHSLSWDELLGSGDASASAASESQRITKQACTEDGCGTDQELAALIYTSGSTGEPKGVMTSHFNMISAARSIIQYLESTPEDIILNVLPISFDYGLYQIIMAFMFRGTVILEKSFLYPFKVLEGIPREKVTGFPIVPTMAALIARMKNLDRLDFASLRYMTNTAAALSVEHIRGLRTLFPKVKIYSMYGLTECKRVSFLAPDELDRKPASVGKPMPGCEALIVDGNGKEAGPGEVGELVVRGPNVMRGYWNAPELTEQVFRRGVIPGEAVLYTGDLFRKDEEGFLYFVGRRDEQIKTKGERVSPREIEDVLCTLNGIAEAAAVGVPDEIFGQAIKCFVVCTPGAALTKKDVLKHCSENMEAFMVPKLVEFVEEIPKTPHGKIDKNLLRTL